MLVLRALLHGDCQSSDNSPLARFRSGMVVDGYGNPGGKRSQTGNQLPYRQCFDATAKTYNLDSDWLTAIAIVESSLNPKAVSSANAVGLMQIKWPQTAALTWARSLALRCLILVLM